MREWSRVNGLLAGVDRDSHIGVVPCHGPPFTIRPYAFLAYRPRCVRRQVWYSWTIWRPGSRLLGLSIFPGSRSTSRRLWVRRRILRPDMLRILGHCLRKLLLQMPGHWKSRPWGGWVNGMHVVMVMCMRMGMVVMMRLWELRLRVRSGLWQRAEGIRLQRTLRRAWSRAEGVRRGGRGAGSWWRCRGRV